MLVRKLPIEIQNHLLKGGAGIKQNIDLENDDIKFSNIVNWDKTYEQSTFWYKINQGHFSRFFELYPRKIDNYSII